MWLSVDVLVILNSVVIQDNALWLSPAILAISLDELHRFNNANQELILSHIVESYQLVI